MKELNNVIYTPWITEDFDFTTLADFLLSKEGKSLHWREQSTRGAKFLPVYSWNLKRQRMSWFPPFNKDKDFQQFIERNVLEYTYPIPDIHILYSPPKLNLPVHVDCSNLNVIRRTPTFKIRYVIHGSADTLYFVDKASNNNKLYIPSDHKSYVINGTAIHGMDNDDQEKLVIAIGWPWKGKNTEFLSQLKQCTEASSDTILFDKIDNGCLSPSMLSTMDYKSESN